ncbi:MAG: hypothetical protein KAI47_26010 [Deltaproteobacteria bacterium]|nr:hypothetical protein [Deltaproteobacteria bacterium]
MRRLLLPLSVVILLGTSRVSLGQPTTRQATTQMSTVASRPSTAASRSSTAASRPSTNQTRGNQTRRNQTPRGQTMSPAVNTQNMRRYLAPVRRAMVRYASPYDSGRGFLVRDHKTVLIDDMTATPSRRLFITKNGLETQSQWIELLGKGVRSAYWVHLQKKSSGSPLPVSHRGAALGDRVYVIYVTPGRNTPTAGAGIEIGVSSVTATTATTLEVGGSSSRILLLLDPGGALLAMKTHGALVKVASLLASPRTTPNPIALPKFTLRVGGGHDGDIGAIFLMEISLGFSLWDRLSLTFHLGLGIGKERLVALDGAGLGHGYTSVVPTRVHLSLETKYRVLLSAKSPLYLDIVAGAQGAFLRYSSTSLAFFSNDPQCDPLAQACSVQIQPGDTYADQLDRDGIGPLFGIDLRFGSLVLGYRFVPGKLSYHLADSHMATVGLNVY